MKGNGMRSTLPRHDEHTEVNLNLPGFFILRVRKDTCISLAVFEVEQNQLRNKTTRLVSAQVAAEGRHNFPNLLRRQKLPKDSLFVPTGYGGVISPRDPQVR